LKFKIYVPLKFVPLNPLQDLRPLEIRFKIYVPLNPVPLNPVPLKSKFYIPPNSIPPARKAPPITRRSLRSGSGVV